MSTTSRSLELAGYRNRLLGAATNVLGPEMAQMAMEVWDHKYAPEKPLALIEFVGELATTFGLEGRQRHEVRMALYKSVFGRTNGQEPAFAMAPVGAMVPPTPGASPEGAFATFEAFCLHLHEAVMAGGKVTPRQIADRMYQTLIVDYDQDQQAEAFVRWTGGGADLKGLAGASTADLSLYARKFVTTLRKLLDDATVTHLVERSVAAVQAAAPSGFSPRLLLR